MIQPFDQSGIKRDAAGIAHYVERPNSLVEMLRATVDRAPNDEAIVEIGGERLAFGELWDRSARIAGGLRAQGVRPGDRVAIRLGNGLRWCLAFFSIQMSGAIAVPVNTRFSEAEVDYVLNDSGASFVFLPEGALPDGEPFVFEVLAKGDVAVS